MEQEQFKIEVVPLRGKLSGCARRLLDDPEDVEDIVQEVFLKLWYIREELERYDSVEALAVQITKHLCLNRLRSFQYRQEKLSDSAIITADDNPYVSLEQKDSVSHVMSIMEQLPGLQQTILRMKHVDGFEVKEIAELTGSTPEAVRVNLSRARKRVKELFLKM
ncbi:sigma-70 family RNA polymerase sigma factor [Parabacteroides acidifaciens]|uniref:Sigma-70 family RNA polymerase sigma factor n=1 Tax=Parabacteroides acidifaciens TaxID=2290935 RepID=A0A3D8HCG2_9BACT|nr:MULTISPECIES: sigma-70 family RNA polymerase sigma factor [Parabacteroides]MBC8602603.1 sigma-70 family RNA polymerase sigma factor [Parabacteroides acidifaciens]RDU48673.1 sigma-70 family RNA polymerase sigma factor [Parabacteroides acidifaciens]RHO74936.1 sigma-70 family RNA polymerase sigma factor [Parabacteroides sp. AF48-14]RHR61683.1 sigma-70 family RNA polymerase sigma factor [Parabacteroides sp. AF17-28]